MSHLGRFTLILFLAPGCITDPEHIPAAALTPVPARRAPADEYLPEPTPGSDCPAPSAEAPFRKGELIMVHGFTPEPSFHMRRIQYFINGKARFNSEEHDVPNSFIVFREVVPAGDYAVWVVATLKGEGEATGIQFLVPSRHTVHTDGTEAVCVDLHFGFKSDTSSPTGREPYLRSTDVPLAVLPN